MNRYRITLCCIIALLAVALPALGDLVGQPAPPLHIASWIKGGPTDIFDGHRIYVVEFWATWCSPCRAVFPHLTALQAAYGNRVEIVAVTDETLDVVTPFVTDWNAYMGYTIACDPSVETRLAYGAEWIPQAFIVGTDGRISWQGHSADLDEPLEAAVATLIFRVTQQPAGKWLEEGSPIKLEISLAGGTGPYHYAWYRNGTSIGGDAPVYAVEHATEQNSGSYYCIATDAAAKTSITSQTTALAVFPEGALPAPHGIALVLLAATLLAAAWATCRPRKSTD